MTPGTEESNWLRNGTALEMPGAGEDNIGLVIQTFFFKSFVEDHLAGWSHMPCREEKRVRLWTQYRLWTTSEETDRDRLVMRVSIQGFSLR
jgi:hypothetical protein